ncbi:uncharacterized protein METZ01_LOCUS417817 [marine metagenome]|uniref:Uncharacterized protein n=1 Tax=marine metagenome TaxID=408172 RepID=A0A382X1W5_9ZZZZ
MLLQGRLLTRYLLLLTCNDSNVLSGTGQHRWFRKDMQPLQRLADCLTPIYFEQTAVRALSPEDEGWIASAPPNGSADPSKGQDKCYLGALRSLD